jgi:TetR/AcrR family transcriptional regulator, transcriptional repressor for nem operon
MDRKIDTAQRILDMSQQMLQVRGYNALSYADVSQAIGIHPSRIQTYFPEKSDLAKALVIRYRQTFFELQSQIDASTSDPLHKLKAFMELYLEGLRSGRMCLCGMLAEDITVLPREVQHEVLSFFDDNEAWLIKVLTEGIETGVVQVKGAIANEARLLLIGLQGAQLMARAYGDLDRFDQMARRLILGLVSA